MADQFIELFSPFETQRHEEFWALKNVSFEIEKGGTVGLIGKNGSGKSTLLQVICSILKPNGGSFAVNGRIAALLELGAGFNPDFTGRENVVFNARMMGYSRAEAHGIIKDVEKFAGVGGFFDKPVKKYSSGMFVRVAFSTAIHVDPDILIVDEALGVGDVQFQRKCYNKFQEFQKAGKTIIFVSHNIELISRYCNRAILLDGGKVISQGEPTKCLNDYLNLIRGEAIIEQDQKKTNLNRQKITQPRSLEEFFSMECPENRCPLAQAYNPGETRSGNLAVEIVDFLVTSKNKIEPAVLYSGDVVEIYFRVKFHQNVNDQNPVFGFRLKTTEGLFIYGLNTEQMGLKISASNPSNECFFKLRLPLNLVSGNYFLNVGVGGQTEDGEEVSFDRRMDLLHFKILPKNEFTGVVDLQGNIQQVSGPPEKKPNSRGPTASLIV